MENQDLKIGLSMLQDIENELNEYYGSTIARGPMFEGAQDANTTKKLLKDLKIAKKKIGDSKEGEAFAAFLQGRIYAVGYDLLKQNSIHRKCINFYDEAIQLGFDEATATYYKAKHKDAWDKKKEAIELYERVVELKGVDDPNGMDAAKQIERLKEKKGGCFIATAVYGSYDAPEVLILRRYRDDILLNSMLGKQFVKFYYLISPPFSRYLSHTKSLKRFIKNNVLTPFVKHIERKSSK